MVWKRDILVVSAFGSSSCPPVATTASALSPSRLFVAFEGGPEPGRACTDDYAPHVSRVRAPAGIDRSDDVYAALTFDGAPRHWIRVEMLHPISE